MRYLITLLRTSFYYKYYYVYKSWKKWRLHKISKLTWERNTPKRQIKSLFLLKFVPSDTNHIVFSVHLDKRFRGWTRFELWLT